MSTIRIENLKVNEVKKEKTVDPIIQAAKERMNKIIREHGLKHSKVIDDMLNTIYAQKSDYDFSDITYYRYLNPKEAQLDMRFIYFFCLAYNIDTDYIFGFSDIKNRNDEERNANGISADDFLRKLKSLLDETINT